MSYPMVYVINEKTGNLEREGRQVHVALNPPTELRFQVDFSTTSDPLSQYGATFLLHPRH